MGIKAPLRVADDWLAAPPGAAASPRKTRTARGTGTLTDGGRHAARVTRILSIVALGDEATLTAEEAAILAAYAARGGVVWRPGDDPLAEADA